LRVTVGPQPIALVLVAFAAATAFFAVAVNARRVLGWALACAVVAAILEPLVRVLDRHIPRLFAILIGLLVFAAVVTAASLGVLSDLSSEYERLEVELPRAAGELQAEAGRLGQLAQDLRLQDRAQELLDRVEDPRSGLASSAAETVSAYFVTGILTAFFLLWGPRIGNAALTQIGDETQRGRVRSVTADAFTRGRVYVLASTVKAVVVGLAVGVACWLEDVPAPVVIGVAAAAASFIPGLGILVAGIPALVLEGGVGTSTGVARLALVIVALQVLDALVIRWVIAPRSLTVGPAAVVIALVLGFEVYGVGGALYSAALAVFLMAGLDAAGRVTGGGGGEAVVPTDAATPLPQSAR